jgi:photosynthetic reaction center H subunit
MARVSGSRKRVTVDSIRGDQFAGVPTTARPDQVTSREEDRICAYYGGGHLYSLPSRSEPVI